MESIFSSVKHSTLTSSPAAFNTGERKAKPDQRPLAAEFLLQHHLHSNLHWRIDIFNTNDIIVVAVWHPQSKVNTIQERPLHFYIIHGLKTQLSNHVCRTCRLPPEGESSRFSCLQNAYFDQRHATITKKDTFFKYVSFLNNRPG